MLMLIDHPKHAYLHKQRIKASHLARKSSDDFCQSHGHSELDSIAPFERDEIILGRRVGSGSFSAVYDLQHFHLRPDQSNLYTKEQLEMRDAVVKSFENGAKFAIKCLKDEVEESDDADLFLSAARDIVHEAEMLAALSHPNIIKLHGIIASRHEAFLGGSSAFFIILERLESTLGDKIDIWAKQKNSFNPSKHLKSLSSSLSSSSSRAVDKVEKTTRSEASVSNRLNVSTSIAEAVEYLHSQGVIFRDLKPDNIGFDTEGNVKLFDFGLSRFISRSHGYEYIFEMSGAGTPRYTAPEVIFRDPYNLKSDVYSFSVVLWEIMCLKQPFAKYKYRNEFDKAISRGESLDINRKWPLPIQDAIRKSLSRDLFERPTMSEIRKTLNDYVSVKSNNCNLERVDAQIPSRRLSDLEKVSTQAPSRRLSIPSKIYSSRFFRKVSTSVGSATDSTANSS